MLHCNDSKRAYYRNARARLATAWMLGLSSLPAAGYAQTADTVIEEITVTAQKRSESLQDVPVSVTALAGEELTQANLDSFRDFAFSVPGLVFTSATPGQSVVGLRGILPTAGDPTVGVYVDEVALPGSPATGAFIGDPEPLLLDLSRVEVLRGPQGTLYGAGSMGGTLKYVTNQPDTSGFYGNASLGVSATEHGATNYMVSGVANAPFTESSAVRMAVQYIADDGWIDVVPTDNLFTGNRSKDNVNDLKSLGARLSARQEFENGLTITPAVFYQRLKIGAPSEYGTNVRRFHIDTIIDEPYDDEFVLPSLTINKDWDAVSLVSVSSYYDRTLDRVDDYGSFVTSLIGRAFGPPYAEAIADNAWVNTIKVTHRRYAQELRLASNDPTSAFSWIVGAYYADTKVRRLQTAFNSQLIESLTAAGLAPLPLTSEGAGETVFHGDTPQETRELAFFADATYRFNEQWLLSVGLRRFENDRDYDNISYGLFNGGLTDDVPNSFKEDGVNPRATVTFQASDDALLYTTVAKGFRAGAPNRIVPSTLCAADLAALGLTDAPDAYESDSVINYEVGSKNQLLDNRLVVNASVFYIKWDDIQQTVPLLGCGFGFTANAGSAVSKGAELEWRAQIGERVRLEGSASYTDAYLTENAPGTGGEDGDSVLGVPDWTYSAAAEYSIPLAHDNRAFARIELQGRTNSRRLFSDVVPGDSISRRLTVQDGWELTNLRLGYETATWSLTAYVDNLLDEQTELGFYEFTQPPPAASPELWDRVWISGSLRPRTYGFTVRRNF